jgi:hypothetical protein
MYKVATKVDGCILTISLLVSSDLPHSGILKFLQSPLKPQMNNTGFVSPIPIPYSSLNQQYQYNPNSNTIPIHFNDSVLFFLALKLLLNTIFCLNALK